jgi:hypothetical protein
MGHFAILDVQMDIMGSAQFVGSDVLMDFVMMAPSVVSLHPMAAEQDM